ncbi:MAG: tail protein X [Alphaproteobacteria bacterium]|nr:tail protein X [Alphaproteobacteria bacterium]
MEQTRARQGDTVDLVAYRHYGDTAMVEKILAANPGLATFGPVLPIGTPVLLPPWRPATRPTVRLWD